MNFHDRKPVFLAGPEAVTVELAQWDASALRRPMMDTVPSSREVLKRSVQERA